MQKKKISFKVYAILHHVSSLLASIYKAMRYGFMVAWLDSPYV